MRFLKDVHPIIEVIVFTSSLIGCTSFSKRVRGVRVFQHVFQKTYEASFKNTRVASAVFFDVSTGTGVEALSAKWGKGGAAGRPGMNA